MNPLQRVMNWGEKRFNEMLFPTDYGGANGWNYTYLSDGIPRVSGPNIIIPGVSDYTVDTHTSSAVMACVNWLCRTFPEAPLQVVRVNREGEREVDTRHKLPSLLETPNPFYSGVLLWDATLADWLIDGNAYWVKIRNSGGQVIQLWWGPQSTIEPRWDEKDSTEFIGYYEYRPDPSKDRRVRLDVSDVVHFRYGIDPHNVRKGLSPLRSLMREIFTDEEAAAYSATLLKNMGVPGIVVSPAANEMGGGISMAEAQQVKETMIAKTTGSKRGEPIVLSQGMKVDVLSFSPEKMNLKDMRRVPEERITATLGIPAIVVGLGAGLDRSTFANYAEARESAYESFIIPNQRRFAADLKTQLLPDFGDTAGVAIQFDTSGVRVLQEDENAKAQRWGQMVRDGIAMVSEARNATGLPVEPEHEVFLRPNNLVEVGANVEPPPPTVTVETTPPAQLPPPEKALEPEFKSYGSAVRAIEGRAARATTAYLQEQYEKAAAAGKGWQRALDMGPEARALYNRFYPLILRHSWNDAAAELGIELAFDLENKWVKEVLDDLAKAIVGIAETTREEVRSLVAKQAEEGWSIDELAAEIRKLKEVHSTARARTIARSETAIAYNKGSLAGYREAGVEKVEVFDGDEHEPCRSANGSIWTIEQAEAEPLCHPNGTRSFAAVVSED
jgi:HK97 family phage portal protein